MRFQIYSIPLSAILLASCSYNAPVKKDNITAKNSGSYIYSNSTFSYSISIPNAAYIPNKSETGAQIFFGNIPFMFKGAKDDQFDILLYGKYSSSCSSSLIGTSKTTALINVGAKAEWGKVTIWDKSGGEGWEPPYDLTHVVCTNSAPYGYALCSQKDKKTVVICINQMTDDPAMAQKIFETFRWTD